MNMQKYYSQLVGARIVDFKFVDDEFDGEAFPVFTLQWPSGKRVEFTLSMDEEGNGAGFAFIEEALS